MNNSLNTQPMANSQYGDLQVIDEQWDSGFDAERCLVFAKIGPYQKLFPRPEQFTQRFYHTLFPLPIEHWQVQDQVGLYDDFCTIAVELDIRFQATFDYVTKNAVALEYINTNIKAAYDDLVRNIVQSKLLNLDDARWVQNGLSSVEKAIALAVSELFLLHDLQAMTSCLLKPTFRAFPELKFKEDAAYLLVLKKSYELTQQKQQTQFSHEQQIEQQKQEQEKVKLENLQAANALVLLKQAQDAEHLKKMLLDQEIQQLERFAVERRLHSDKVKQETLLNELSLNGKFEQLEKQEFLERQLAEKTIDEKMAHQHKIKEKELAAKIKLYDAEKQSWGKVKEQSQQDELKQRQRQKQLQINAEIENKAYLHRQQLLLENQLMLEKLRQSTKSTPEMLGDTLAKNQSGVK
ncbi:MAG: hypothetical protein HOP02_01660 [Methylococcaceae bacterium]|nr:hypothetical protein [Methylococcaceae bacterium]